MKVMNYTSLIISVAALVLVICIATGKTGRAKIAYVRSTELVYGYFGMQEAKRDFEQKAMQWKNNLDTLQKDMTAAINKYKVMAASLTSKEKQEQERMLDLQQQQLLDYQQAIENKSKEEDQKMTQGVLNQVNSFVEEYGKRHGYEVILGTTAGGSILYGEESIDITKEILEELNKQFKKN